MPKAFWIVCKDGETAGGELGLAFFLVDFEIQNDVFTTVEAGNRSGS